MSKIYHSVFKAIIVMFIALISFKSNSVLGSLSIDISLERASDTSPLKWLFYANFSFLIKPFYYVEDLQLYLADFGYMRNGHFGEYKSLKKLLLSSHKVDSQLFIGLEHIVELTLEHTLPEAGALSPLKNLEIIKINTHWDKDDYKQSLVDGLVSLKEIVIYNPKKVGYNESKHSYVYFENLNKFILESIYFILF